MNRPRRAAFRRGLVCLHPLVLVIALALLVPALGGLQHAVTGGSYTSLPLSVLLRVPRDDYLKTSYDATVLKLHPPRLPAIYVFGGSAAREAFSSDRGVEAQIAAAGGGRTSFNVLASSNQTFGQSLAVIDNLPPSKRAVCVITLNQVRFAYDRGAVEEQLAGKPLLLDSPSLRRYVSAHYHRGWRTPSILPGILDFVSGWFEKHHGQLLHGHLPRLTYVLHRYHQGHQVSDRRKHAMVAKWLREKGSPGGTFDRDFRYNLDLLDEVVKAAQAKGFTVVLLEVPLNRDIVGHAFDRVQQVYRPAVEQLAQRRGVVYLRSFSERGLVNRDFRDLSHLVESGRAKYEAAFAKAVVPILRGLEAQSGS